MNTKNVRYCYVLFEYRETYKNGFRIIGAFANKIRALETANYRIDEQVKNEVPLSHFKVEKLELQ